MWVRSFGTGLLLVAALGACDPAPTVEADEPATAVDAGPADDTDAVALAEQTIDNAMAATQAEPAAGAGAEPVPAR